MKIYKFSKNLSAYFFCMLLAYNQNVIAQTNTEKTLKNKNAYEINQAQSKYEESFYSNDFCRKAYPDFKGFYCYQSKDTAPSIQVLGDSHANRLIMGISQYTNENILHLSSHGCPPFFNTYSPKSEGSNQCDIFTNEALRIALETKSIKTVVLAYRGSLYLDDPYKVALRNAPDQDTPEKVFLKAIPETLDKLTTKDKRIIFVYDNAAIDFDPRSCGKTLRPLTLNTSKSTSECQISRVAVSSQQSKYRSLLNKVLKKYPKVKIVDSLEILCDIENCNGVLNGIELYRDSDHLTYGGSILVGGAISKNIMK